MRRPRLTARVAAWCRARPLVTDSTVAVVVAGLALGAHLTSGDLAHATDPDPLGTALVLASTLPIAWRRRRPEAVLVVVLTAQLVSDLLGYMGANGFGLSIALYTVVSRTPARRALHITVVVGLLALLTNLIAVAVNDAEPGDLAAIAAILTITYLVGDVVRGRRERLAALEDRAERAEREQELLSAQRVRDERARIARELHDVVAHSLTVMVVQAAAARRQLAGDPGAAARALTTVETTGRQAMAEMRQVLGVLRSDGGSEEGGGLAPPPTLDMPTDPTLVDPPPTDRAPTAPCQLRSTGLRGSWC